MPRCVTIHVKVKSLAVTVVTNFVFDLIARDQPITHDAHVVMSTASIDRRGYLQRQPTIFDVLSDAQPQRDIPQSGHSRGDLVSELFAAQRQPVAMKVWA